jgi:hypothetical protein
MSWGVLVKCSLFFSLGGMNGGGSYLVDVLALELGEELLEALAVGLNTDRLEHGLDVGSGGRGVATEAEEEVGCEVLHFACGVVGGKELSTIDLTCAGQYVCARAARETYRMTGD